MAWKMIKPMTWKMIELMVLQMVEPMASSMVEPMASQMMAETMVKPMVLLDEHENSNKAASPRNRESGCIHTIEY